MVASWYLAPSMYRTSSHNHVQVAVAAAEVEELSPEQVS